MPENTEQMCEAARKTICHFAKDAPEARDFMLMLGIYPGQEDDGGHPHNPPPLNRVINPVNWK